MFLTWTMYSSCCNDSIPLFHTSEPTGKHAHWHTCTHKSYHIKNASVLRDRGTGLHSTHIRETKISGVILTVLSLTPWRYMHSTVKQTLTSCLLARNIWRHAQREGRRKKEQSTKERRKRQASEGVSPFRNTRLQLERKIEKIWRRKVFSDELDTPWIRLEGKVKVLKHTH